MLCPIFLPVYSTYLYTSNLGSRCFFTDKNFSWKKLHVRNILQRNRNAWIHSFPKLDFWHYELRLLFIGAYLSAENWRSLHPRTLLRMSKGQSLAEATRCTVYTVRHVWRRARKSDKLDFQATSPDTAHVEATHCLLWKAAWDLRRQLEIALKMSIGTVADNWNRRQR